MLVIDLTLNASGHCFALILRIFKSRTRSYLEVVLNRIQKQRRAIKVFFVQPLQNDIRVAIEPDPIDEHNSHKGSARPY
jgi:hypothetical protein